MRLDPFLRKPTVEYNVLTLDKFSVPFELRNYQTKEYDIRKIYIPRSRDILEIAQNSIGLGCRFYIELTRRHNLEVSVYSMLNAKFPCSYDTNENRLDEVLNMLIKNTYAYAYINTSLPRRL